MATITKRKGGWFVQIRRKGYQPRFQTFARKAEAESWARTIEAEIDGHALPVDHRAIKQTSLGDVLSRYRDQITPTKKGAESESLRLARMMKEAICAVALPDLRPAMFASYRDKRLAVVKPATVVKELGLFRVALNVARREWGLHLSVNPVEMISKPKVFDARDRRLIAGELERLEAALIEVRNPFIGPAVRFTIETGLRRSELLGLRWTDLQLEERLAVIPQTKTGIPRAIPLTDTAISILRSLTVQNEKVFPVTPNALRLSWNRIRIRASLADLRFHDLRHEAISRFAEMGLNIAELALISGHRDPRMLFRYTHLRPSDLARKLSGRSWVQEVGSRQIKNRRE